MDDLISRQDAIDDEQKLINKEQAIDKIKKRLFETAFNNVGIKQNIDETLVDVAENRLENWFNELPPVQPELDIWNDGTLHISAGKGQLDKIGRVLVTEDGIIFFRLFYQDAEPEIIRCKECKYYREYGYVNGKPKFLPKCTFNSIYVNVDDFCSKAERR